MVVWSRIRRDFPVLNELYEGKGLIYFDSACMALKPIQVWEAMEYYYKYLGACGGAGRSTHSLGVETSLLTEESRQKIATFINAKSSNEIVWTRNATEGLNIVAATLPIKKDENVVTTSLEHHSGMLPFFKKCQETGSELRIVNAKPDGTFDPADFEEKIDDKTKIVSFVHASNLTGTIAPLEEIVKIAHEHDAWVVSDEAQFAPHDKLDVQKLDVDFSVLSIHKACGPTGIGVLYGKYERLEELGMFLVGGEKGIIQEQKEVFDCVANKVVHCGDLGCGVTMKLINNMCVQNICMAVNECLALGVKSGLDLKQMLSVFSSTAASNKVMEEVYQNSLFINDFSLGFSLNLAYKDVGHALRLAADKGVPCPVAAITHQWQSIARSKGTGNKDHSSLATIIEDMADVKLRI